jgi:hypothetical protein
MMTNGKDVHTAEEIVATSSRGIIIISPGFVADVQKEGTKENQEYKKIAAYRPPLILLTIPGVPTADHAKALELYHDCRILADIQIPEGADMIEWLYKNKELTNALKMDIEDVPTHTPVE